MKKYILYSPAKGDCGERALYRRRGMPERRYRREFPDPGSKTMYLAKFRSMQEAMEEREALHSHCGEWWQIRIWLDGRLGPLVTVMKGGEKAK
ncbi:MAG: hypothetical protein J6K72_08500 [Clostridia bacterium]|nr:hypothetical protein [Clostridia bacterium]